MTIIDNREPRPEGTPKPQRRPTIDEEILSELRAIRAALEK